MDDPAQFHGRQLTAARALADLTIAELAEQASVTVRTVHRIETGGPFKVAPGKRHGHVSSEVWQKIVGALAKRGVELTPATDAYGAGARWAEPGSAKN